MLAKLLRKRVTLAVSEATSLPTGVEFSGVVARFDPETGPSHVTGVVVEVDAPLGSRYSGAHIIVTSRIQGRSLEEILQGDAIPVNFQLIGAEQKFSAVGIGTLSIGGED